MWSVAESDSVRTEWPKSPPPPWPASVRATIWWHRATPRAVDYGPRTARVLPWTLAMMVEYVDSPVGPYREILASPVLRRPGAGLGLLPSMAVPFIAVDSAISVHGGREHWNLPKVLAEFDGSVLATSAVRGDDWSVSATAEPKGPAFPMRGALGFAQPVSGGLSVAKARLTGRARLARVTVSSEGPTLPNWLKAGTHFGLQVVRGGMTTGPSVLVGAADAG